MLGWLNQERWWNVYIDLCIRIYIWCIYLTTLARARRWPKCLKRCQLRFCKFSVLSYSVYTYIQWIVYDIQYKHTHLSRVYMEYDHSLLTYPHKSYQIAHCSSAYMSWGKHITEWWVGKWILKRNLVNAPRTGIHLVDWVVISGSIHDKGYLVNRSKPSKLMFGMANLLPNAVFPSWYPKFLSHDPQHAPEINGPTIGLATKAI